ncbi:MAG TPA: serine/threonine-protein kinase [Haliangiales bacterium]|nr:serine/threonine-protein kinase [Haliangiales bacterium]
MKDDPSPQDEASAATLPVDGSISGPGPPAGEELPRGTFLGRYVVLDVLGTGGMAVVYAAYDPELGRKVAVKLLHREVQGPTGGTRLLREAQAMAKLHHPNVVAVHDVGTFGDSVFLAMELVEGRPLRAWLGERGRPWRQILDAFLQAGRGLAAAHAAGIVHRDFKPENVLVGDDGTVRVADFGLARPAASEEEPDEKPASPPAGSSRLTRTGALVGTPFYMAPEQHRRERSDARSDQFSFCIALYEALYRQHPFGRGKLDDLARAVLAGAVLPAPPRPRVPGWVRVALLRGLSPAPDDRWPSMGALLAALSRDPAAGRRRGLVVAAVAAGMGLGALAVIALRRPAADACAVAPAWDDARRGAVRAAFAATGKPFAETAAKEAIRALDDYAAVLGDARAAACRTAAERDPRRDCLDRRQAQLGALADVFARADAQVVERAAAAVEALPPVAACADADEAALPDDPTARQKVTAARARLAHVAALDAAGKYKAALPLAREVVEAARAANHAPLVAEALTQLGALEFDNDDPARAEATLEDALFAAEAARNDRAAAAAAIQLVRVVSFATPRYDEGRRWGRMAQAVVDRMGPRAQGIDARLLAALGRLEFNRARYADAAELERRALALQERRGPDTLATADVLLNLAEALNADGHYRDARAPYQRALSIQLSHLGPEHPDVAWTYKMLGTLAWAEGRWAEARGHYLRAIAIIERALDPDALVMASVVNNLAVVDIRMGRVDDAVAEYRRAVDIWERKLGADNPKVAIGRHNLGDAYLRAGRLPEARAELERARAILDRAFGPDHVRLVGTLASLSELALAEGNVAAARAMSDRALAIADKGLGPDSVERAEALHASGAARLAQGDAAGAIERHRIELAVYEKASGPDSPSLCDTLVALGRAQLAAGAAPAAVATLERAARLDGKDARARFRLAQAVWAAGDRPRALALAAAAHDELVALGPTGARDLADARAWLTGKR